MTQNPNIPGHDETAHDRLLSAHLAQRLDPHVGQARRRFEEMLAAEAPAPIPLHRAARGGGLHWPWSLGLLAAAAVATFAVGLWVFDSRPPASPPMVANNGEALQDSPARFTPIEYRESWQSQDLGTYQVGGRPVRAVHQQQWETARYRDARGYEVRIEVPASQIVLVDAQLQ